ncbi:MAG: hypothetical protein QF473_32755, partial [Planctomycetota bacterium]|nr:hypothetical protein [Planctomycetota bacterium]
TEIQGGRTSAATRCMLRREPDDLILRVDAEDPAMLDLLSSVSPPGRDDFLYEEDCLQIALGAAGETDRTDFLLVNPHGSRKGSPSAETWQIETVRRADGWQIVVRIPIPAGIPCIGFSLHRFYRGVHHEVQGHGTGLPHPPRPEQFLVIVLKDDQSDAATGYRHSIESQRDKELKEQLASCRARIRQAEGPKASLETAKMFTGERLKQPCKGLWNETYFQHALIDLWEIEGDAKWLDTAITRMEEAWSTRGQADGDTVWGEPLPTWYEKSRNDNAMTLVTGVMLYPIARLMDLVHRDPSLDNYWPQVEPWLPMCQEVIDTHEREWVEFNDGSGFYLEPYLKGPQRLYPRGGSRMNPLNRALWLAAPMMHIGRILGREDYIRKVIRMARYFKNNCETVENGGLVWEYLVSRYPAEGEDISHAHCQLFFAELCCSEGIVFTEGDLQKMAITLDENVFRHSDVPCNTLRGYQPGIHLAVGAWTSLCRFFPHLFPRIVAVVETSMAEGQFDFTKEGWGVRILTMIEKARAVAQVS